MPTTADLLAQLERWLPQHYRSVRPITAGRAAQAALASDTLEDLEGSVSIGGAEGPFLSLLSRGYGVPRASGESDESLRYRLRNVERKITRPAILERINTILSSYGAAPAVMYEHFESGGFCDQDYADLSTIYSSHNAFTLVVPRLGDDDRVSDYADLSFADDAFGGPAHTHPAYIVIMAEAERLRAAGIRWWLQIVPDEELRVSIEVTLHLGHLTSSVQEWPFFVPEGYRLTRVSSRPSVSPSGGTLGLYRVRDGEDAVADGTDQFEAGPIALTGDTALEDVDRTADLKVATDDRDSAATTGSFWVLVGTNIDITSTEETVAVPLTFTPVN